MKKEYDFTRRDERETLYKGISRREQKNDREE